MRKSPRLVLDTNILVAAVLSRLGPSFALIQLIRIGRVQMCCSPALFLEYEAVLNKMASATLTSTSALRQLEDLVVLGQTFRTSQGVILSPFDVYSFPGGLTLVVNL